MQWKNIYGWQFYDVLEWLTPWWDINRLPGWFLSSWKVVVPVNKTDRYSTDCVCGLRACKIKYVPMTYISVSISEMSLMHTNINTLCICMRMVMLHYCFHWHHANSILVILFKRCAVFQSQDSSWCDALWHLSAIFMSMFSRLTNARRGHLVQKKIIQPQISKFMLTK